MLIIDAMDLLYTRKFDGFCLVSSDSDFTGLAIRLKEEGLKVLGFGEKKTPEAFKNACHKFIFTEVLRNSEQQTQSEDPKKQVTSITVEKNQIPSNSLPKEFILSALEKSCDDTGWANLGTFGSFLNQLKPDFDSRLFGFKKLSDLVKANKDVFITEERIVPGSNNKNLYVKAK